MHSAGATGKLSVLSKPVAPATACEVLPLLGEAQITVWIGSMPLNFYVACAMRVVLRERGVCTSVSEVDVPELTAH